MGLSRQAKGVALTLSSFVATALKDEAEVTKQRNKARDARKGGAWKGTGPESKSGAKDE